MFPRALWSFALVLTCLSVAACNSSTAPAVTDNPDLATPAAVDTVLIASCDSTGDWICGSILGFHGCDTRDCEQILRDGVFSMKAWCGSASCGALNTRNPANYANFDSVWATGQVEVTVRGKGSYGCFGRYRVTNSDYYGGNFYYKQDFETTVDTTFTQPIAIGLSPKHEPDHGRYGSFHLGMYVSTNENDCQSRIDLKVKNLHVWGIRPRS